MPRRATRMPLEMPEIPNLITSMPSGPTGLDQVQDILRRYERDNYRAFVQGLEPPRPMDPLDVANGAALNTATLTVQQIEQMQRAVIEANERMVIRQRDEEVRRMQRQRRSQQMWHTEIMGEFQPATEWQYPPTYVERERVQPRRHTTLITIPRSSFQRILRETAHTNAVTGSHRDPEGRGTIWGIPIRISDTGAITSPIMEVTDGIRNVAMHFPEDTLMNPGLLSDFQRELYKRLDFEHEQAGDRQLASKALPYGYMPQKSINRKSKVRSLIYEKED